MNTKLNNIDEPENSLYSDGHYYDLVMGWYADEQSLNFFQRQIRRYGEPVLELACGSGRFTVPLAQQGINITGLDFSQHMLKHAMEKSSECGVAIEFLQGDMRAFDLDRQFKFIFIAAQSLSHLYKLEDIEACFAAVRRHLAPDGRFLIEIFNPSLRLLDREPGQRYPVGEYTDPTTASQIVVTEEVRYDAATQINHIEWYFRKENTATEKQLLFTMRQFFPQEINALLSYNGFTVEHKYGDYEEAIFSSSYMKQLIISRAG